MDMNNLGSFQSETEVIGACLGFREKAIDELTILEPKHFSDRGFAVAFEAILAMSANSDPIDVFAVDEWLTAHDKAGYCQVTSLVEAQQASANWQIKKHEQIIIDRYEARQALQYTQAFADSLLHYRGAKADELIQGLSNQLSELNQTSVDDNATYDAADLMKIALTEFSARLDNKGKFTGLSTGIKSLDDKLFGLQKGNVYVFAGRPGMGKKAISMSIAENVADTYKDAAVLVFNLEMSKEQLAMRSLASTAGVSLSDIQNGDDDGGMNYAKMNQACEIALQRKLFCDVRGNITMNQIRGKARKIKNKHGLNLIVIDYLGLINDQGTYNTNDNSRISWLSRQIKMLAKDIDVPVILLSQLSRKCEDRADKRPMLSDLRDSGAIEQDADAVIFSYRDGYYTKNNGDNLLELIVAKQRMGETGTAYAWFEGQYSKVTDVDDATACAVIAKRHAKVEKPKGRSL